MYFHYITMKIVLGCLLHRIAKNCQTEKWKENVSHSEVIYGYFPQGYIFKGWLIWCILSRCFMVNNTDGAVIHSLTIIMLIKAECRTGQYAILTAVLSHRTKWDRAEKEVLRQERTF